MDLETVKLEDRPEPFYLVAIPGYMAACSDKETAQKYAKGETGGIARQLSSETAAAFLDADLSLYVNVREVNARYGSQLKTYKSLANVFLKGDAVQGVNKSHVEQLRTVVNAAFQVLEDGPLRCSPSSCGRTVVPEGHGSIGDKTEPMEPSRNTNRTRCNGSECSHSTGRHSASNS